jgi:hypothetical protein
MAIFYTTPQPVSAIQVTRRTTVDSRVAEPGDWLVERDGTVAVMTDKEVRESLKTLDELRAFLDQLDGVLRTQRRLRSNIYAQIASVLRGGPKTRQEILRALPGRNPGTLYNALTRGKKLPQRLWALENGRYRLLSTEQAGGRPQGLLAKAG